MAVQWNLLGVDNPNPGQMFKQGMQEGHQLRRERDTRNALQAYSADPTPQNLNALIALNPEIGTRLGEFQHKQGEWARDEQYRNAMADYYAGGGAASSPRLPAPLASAGASAQAAPPVEGAPQDAQVTAAPPADPRAEAFKRAMRADPTAALAARQTEYKMFSDRLKVANDAYGFAIAQLAAVNDDASYQRALAQSAERFAPLGIDIRGMVPPTFPGPEGVRQLLRSAMESKDQLSALDREKRLEWDIKDDELDNARDDRNVSSLITDRNERRVISREGIAAGNSRAAQASADRRYGIDRTSEDRRYGIDKTDTRTREGWVTPKAKPQRMGGGTAGSSKANPVSVNHPTEAEKLPKGTWFRDAKTGATYQRN